MMFDSCLAKLSPFFATLGANKVALNLSRLDWINQKRLLMMLSRYIGLLPKSIFSFVPQCLVNKAHYQDNLQRFF